MGLRYVQRKAREEMRRELVSPYVIPALPGAAAPISYRSRLQKRLDLGLQAAVGDRPAVGGLAEGRDLPLAVVAVEARQDEPSVREADRELVFADLLLVGAVEHPAEGVADDRELLPAVAGHREDDVGDVGGHLGEIDGDALVVAVAVAGEVVSGVTDRPITALEVAVVDRL